MYGNHAELKCSVTKADFLRLYETFLEKDKKSLDMQIKQQIIYFADNKNLDFHNKDHLILRYRWNNRGLEVVVKKRGISKEQIKKLEKSFVGVEGHEFKIDIDQVSQDDKTLSCTLKHVYNSVHQSFAFFQTPEELLTVEQKKFLHSFTKTPLTHLNYLIPIQSKTFIFPLQYKEFDLISLEERRMPKLFGNKFYEVTFKTANFSKKTLEHFRKCCEEYKIPLHEQGIYKTQWLYDAYFNV